VRPAVVAQYRSGVVLGHRQLAARAEPDAARRDRPGQHDDQIRSEALNLRLHATLRTGADGHHRDDGSHADDDAEHGETGAHLVRRECHECKPGRAAEFHGCFQRWMPAASIRWASIGS
jgi:hypothetical protein